MHIHAGFYFFSIVNEREPDSHLNQDCTESKCNKHVHDELGLVSNVVVVVFKFSRVAFSELPEDTILSFSYQPISYFLTDFFFFVHG